MPAAKIRLDAKTWIAVETAIRSGAKSVREIADEYHLPYDALRQRVCRAGWGARQAVSSPRRSLPSPLIEAAMSHVTKRVASDVTAIADTARRWVQRMIERGETYISLCEAVIRDHQQRGETVPADVLDALSRVESRVDDMVRRSLGLPDAPQPVEVSQTHGIIVLPAPGSEPPLTLPITAVEVPDVQGDGSGGQAPHAAGVAP